MESTRRHASDWIRKELDGFDFVRGCTDKVWSGSLVHGSRKKRKKKKKSHKCRNSGNGRGHVQTALQYFARVPRKLSATVRIGPTAYDPRCFSELAVHRSLVHRATSLCLSWLAAPQFCSIFNNFAQMPRGLALLLATTQGEAADHTRLSLDTQPSSPSSDAKSALLE